MSNTDLNQIQLLKNQFQTHFMRKPEAEAKNRPHFWNRQPKISERGECRLKVCVICKVGYLVNQIGEEPES